jgi:siderophore synthetase component
MHPQADARTRPTTRERASQTPQNGAEVAQWANTRCSAALTPGLELLPAYGTMLKATQLKLSTLPC